MTVAFTINGQPCQAPEGTLIIEACQRAGIAIPRYCFHPALTVVGSCRMCLVEIEPAGKLVPSCQTHVGKDVNILTDSPKVQANRRAVMEYLLINHPLDCPVCDQAGECYLQDYAFNHGSPLSRFAEEKIKQPKKDVGRNIMLYMDRCVLCSRCVRFTREIAGTGELTITGRGNHSEIDIFPGRPLDNKMSGCVADICPVGALLDKKFLHRQRVWRLSATPSICGRCSAGCNINIFHNQGQIWRLKPRENAAVNGPWMCDEGRYGWDHVHDGNRLDFRVRATSAISLPLGGGSKGEGLAELIRSRLSESVRSHGAGSLSAVLSPMWTAEEQFMLARVVRALDPQATLALGPVPVVGSDETFKCGFTIRAEKCPNRRGAERVLAAMSGPQASFDALLAKLSSSIHALWLSADYPPDVEWLTAPQASRLKAANLLLVVSDMFPGPAMDAATIQLPGGSWAERSGTFVNCAGLVQQLLAAPVGPEFAAPAADLLWRVLGQTGPVDLVDLWHQMADAKVEGYPPPPPADPIVKPAPFAGNRSAPGVCDSETTR
ncbi:MAG: 2Fe-2S iron-sulfur cluster-binding protein [Phycisphaerae bacterium]|nr:2Fe-2S iron-sulfur cluster-binding protein [Phycisphaerae bacterium]